MKKIINVFLVLMLTVAAVAAQEKTKVSDTSRDEAQIRANVEQTAKGWNVKSGADFARSFAEDADYVVINGMTLKGREMIGKAHQEIFDTFYKNSSVEVAVQKIRFLRPDVAVVHVTSLLKVTENNQTQTGRGIITMVMTKTGDKWEIAAFQNTSVREEQPQKK